MSQTTLIAGLIEKTMGSEIPAAQQIQNFFKSHPEFGSKDRARFADEFWRLLRLQPLPDWLTSQVSHAIGDGELSELTESLALPGTLDLRVNISKCRPEQALQALRDEGIFVEPSPIISEALHVQGKPNIEKSQAYQRGMIEVQDLGSQLLARLVRPRRGQLIVDFCAGAGGKALALASALRGSGKVYALDVSGPRLAKLAPRKERSGLDNIWPLAITGLKDSRLASLRHKADAVLVDAPCSGTGTLRRSPDLRWRISQENLGQFTSQQAEILRAAALLVRPGGRLVYATCSLLPSENSAIIEGFLSEHPDAQRVLAKETLESQGICLPAAWRPWSEAGDLWLWPHRTGTDGFYASVLRLGASA